MGSRTKVAPLRERVAFNRETMTEETSIFYLVKVKQRGQGRSTSLTQINSCLEERLEDGTLDAHVEMCARGFLPF